MLHLLLSFSQIIYFTAHWSFLGKASLIHDQKIFSIHSCLIPSLCDTSSSAKAHVWIPSDERNVSREKSQMNCKFPFPPIERNGSIKSHCETKRHNDFSTYSSVFPEGEMEEMAEIDPDMPSSAVVLIFRAIVHVLSTFRDD